jgi:hypothetical protein
LQELRSQSFDFGAGRLAHGIASQPLPASLLEFFRPAIVARVQILVDAFLAAKLGYAVSPRNTAITIRPFFLPNTAAAWLAEYSERSSQLPPMPLPCVLIARSIAVRWVRYLPSSIAPF